MQINEIFQAAILGTVQGLTEFLPISSSGHLILIPELLGWRGVVNSLSFDVALHFGSTIAVVGFFWRDWGRIIAAFLQNLPKGSKAVLGNFDSKLLVLIIIGSIPAGIAGLIFENYFESAVRNPTLIASALIVFALVLFLADLFGKKSRKFESLGWSDALWLGLAQTLALVPGVSRSGITITAGLFKQLDREAAARFSFLLSTPIIVAASVLSVKDITRSYAEGNLLVFFVGFVFAAVSGWLAIKLLLNFVKRNNFNIFVVYRILLGLGILLFLFTS